MTANNASLAPREAEIAQRGPSRRRRLPKPVTFWVAVAMIVLFLYASATPTPLYGVYQATWRFSATTLTAVFAIYVLFLLATLLVFGSLSDHIGRRPVVIAAIVVNAVACVMFLVANGPLVLFAGRALSGVAIGATANSLSAVLLDLRPSGRLAPLMASFSPSAGLALGALITSVLVQYGPAPTHLPWWLLLGAFAAALVMAAVMPETGTRRPGALASMRPHVSVPRPARGGFAQAVPAFVAVFALGGFYLSLGPTLAAQLTGSRNLLWGGVVVFLLTGVAAAASLAIRKVSAPAQMLGGCLALMVGAGITIAAIETGAAAVLLLGTAVAGLGYGPAFTGAFRTVVALAPADDRAGLASAIFTVSYLSTGVPTLVAGITTTQFGLHGTALVFSAAVTGLSAAGASTFCSGAIPVSARRRQRHDGMSRRRNPRWQLATKEEHHGKDRTRRARCARPGGSPRPLADTGSDDPEAVPATDHSPPHRHLAPAGPDGSR